VITEGTIVQPDANARSGATAETSTGGEDRGWLTATNKVRLVAGGLVLLALLVVVLTYFYWRHTRPEVAPVGEADEDDGPTADTPPAAADAAPGIFDDPEPDEASVKAPDRQQGGSEPAGSTREAPPVVVDPSPSFVTAEDLKRPGTPPDVGPR
jgi:hypothetical protein